MLSGICLFSFCIMVTVSLVTLALLINAIACALAFRYVQREFRLTLNALTRKMREQRKQAKETAKRQDDEIADIRDAVKQAVALMTPEKQKGLLLGASFRDKMEDRHIADLAKQKQVTVQGIPANGHSN